MRVILLSKHTINNNCLGIDALSYLCNNNLNVVMCVSKQKDDLYDFCKKTNIPVTNDINDCIQFSNIDLIISYGWGNLITPDIIELPKLGCINFHPAPLPEWKGMGGVFNYALYENITNWGCSAHFVDKTFDTGDIIKTNYFSIKHINTISSLTKLSHIHTLSLFKEVITMYIQNKTIPRKSQPACRYISKQDLDTLREIHLTDSIEIIDNKIESCFNPPYPGAYVTINGKQYTLINNNILNKIKFID
tara:strand:+ start:713 stop:1456 length:744 start_codon:yes stop_codon:yes gene_type:complete